MRRVLPLLLLLAGAAAPGRAAAADLTGTWTGDDHGVYYVRQVGDEVWWLGVSDGQGYSFANVFHGTLSGAVLAGDWADVPRGRTAGHGKLTLAASATTMRRQGSSGSAFGGSVWKRVAGAPAAARRARPAARPLVPLPPKPGPNPGPRIPFLGGTWRGNDGGDYYLRQIGSTLWWAGIGPPGTFANVFVGTVGASGVSGTWADVPAGRWLNHGSLALALRRDGRLTRTSGAFGGSVWTRTTILDCGGPAVAPGKPIPIGRPDSDGDGVTDSCERSLAEEYAPIVYHSSDESNYPTSVDWFLPKTSLRFYDDDCTPDLDRPIVPLLGSQAALLGRTFRGGCGSTDTVRSDGSRSPDKQRTFYLADVPDRFRIGSLAPAQWKTYYHAYPNAAGGVTVQYWRFYAYNDAFFDHGGDWEGAQAVLDAAFRPQSVALLGHTGIEREAPSRLEWEGTHPHVYSQGGGHASEDRGGDIRAIGCGGLPTGTDDRNPCTFTRQETWDGGHVQWCRNAAVEVCRGGVVPGGGLVDVGERTAPMNGQEFVRYSGLWGSPGSTFYSSGYWGPAFNETELRSDGFDTAWCAGMLRDAATLRRECYPAAVTR